MNDSGLPSPAVLAAQRQEYRATLTRWLQYMHLYEGEDVEQYLFKHMRESLESVANRRERVHYLNYTRPVVDLYTHYVYSKPIVRKANVQEVAQARGTEGEIRPDQVLAGGLEELGSLILGQSESDNSEWGQWQKDVDLCGNSIDRFMADTTRYALLLGHVFVLIDLPALDQPLASELERQERQHRPYLVRYYPTEAPCWAVDDFGKLLWIRFREPLPDDENPFADKLTRADLTAINSRGTPVLYTATGAVATTEHQHSPYDGIYRTWTKKEFFVHQIKEGAVSILAQGTHPLGEVPVVPVYSSRSLFAALKSVSLVRDISRINVSILNWSSLLDEEIYQKTLNILCLQKSRDDQTEIIIGSHNALEYEGAAPFFLAPSSDPGGFIASQIDRLREEIYRIAKLGGGLGLQTPQQTPSGISQAFEFNETNRTLADVALEAERAEQEIHRLWHKWLKKDWEGTVDYPDDFSVESFKEELEALTGSKQAIRSPTFKREMEKKVARKLMRNVPPVIAAIVEAEIDILPEIVMGPFGPQYVTPGQPPGAVDTNADEISQSPFAPRGDQGQTATAGDTAGASAGTSPENTEG